VEGALDRLANPARQMDVCCVDHDSLRVLLDANDPVERMLLFLCLLLMAGQMDHLLLVRMGEITFQIHNAGGIFVVDAAAGRTQSLGSPLGARNPSPAPLVIDDAALRADRTLV